MFNRNRNLKIVGLVLCIVLILSMLSFAKQYEPFKVELTLFERFIALSLLPAEGNYRTLKIIRELQLELAPSEEEVKLAGLKDLKGGGTDAENWEAVPLKMIIFGEVSKSIITDALTKLDEEEKLTYQHYTLFEKFVTYAEKPKEGE